MKVTVSIPELVFLHSQVKLTLIVIPVSQLKYVFRLEENVSRAVGQNSLTTQENIINCIRLAHN